MEGYLDPQKSVIISAPAGSGKTEKLSRRYISLLESGSGLEKILAITFTEKAAAEMKDRVLSIMRREKPDLFERNREKIPLMRITTIHAFCKRLITRFAMDLGLNPAVDVLDEFRAKQLWAEAVYDALRAERKNPAVFFDYLKFKGIKGWSSLFATLTVIHQKRPYTEFLVSERPPGLSAEEEQLLELYGRCFSVYQAKKLLLGVIDFNDMEVLAFRAITTNPQWLNILYAFDEHTDHILVDEFQDTNSVQWRIIDALTEEWRSGLGAKRSEGKTPTIFLVGDEKQSIYMFRGANVSVFQEVKERFSEWLGKEALYIEAKENYRSLPAIIDFTNSLFSHIMAGLGLEPWRTSYTAFYPTRQGEGKVEVILFEGRENAKMTRAREAELVSHAILSIVDGKRTLPDSGRSYKHSDICILLRNRTHLASFETSLRAGNIPYVVVGGIGFYDEPEVALLREFVSFLADPVDNFSLFVILRSPLIGLSGDVLFELLSVRDSCLFDNLKNSSAESCCRATATLMEFIDRAVTVPLSVLTEEFLTRTNGWEIFWERQRHANIKKFLGIIEEYESTALSLLEIREQLIISKRSNESKANVNTETLDAVRIMTVHGSKGLQFPVVFLPSLDESPPSKAGAVCIDEVDHMVRFAYQEEPARRNKDLLFVLRKAKEAEEEKRLFYVAVTRAMDWLIMSGAVRKDTKKCQKIKGAFSFIEEAFPGSISEAKGQKGLFAVTSEEDISAGALTSGVVFSKASSFFQEPVYTERISFGENIERWVDVTEDIEIEKRQSPEDWSLLGSLFHRIFEGISKGLIQPVDLDRRTDEIVRKEVRDEKTAGRYIGIVSTDIRKLLASPLFSAILLPTDNGHTELPFILQRGSTVYRGRIDRVIIQDGTAHVYDYKTFPVKEKEVGPLADQYRFQISIYCEAVEKLFKIKTKGYIIFTNRPELVQIV